MMHLRISTCRVPYKLSFFQDRSIPMNIAKLIRFSLCPQINTMLKMVSKSQIQGIWLRLPIWLVLWVWLVLNNRIKCLYLWIVVPQVSRTLATVITRWTLVPTKREETCSERQWGLCLHHWGRISRLSVFRTTPAMVLVAQVDSKETHSSNLRRICAIFQRNYPLCNSLLLECCRHLMAASGT